MWYVKGGIFKDTSFREAEVPESYGPFDTFNEALEVWRTKTFSAMIDNNCLYRLEIYCE